VPAGGGKKPPAHAGLPPDFVDFLMGRVRMPVWLGRIRLNMGRPSVGSALLLQGPTPSPARLRPPSLSPEGGRQRRQAYGEQLVSSYERPQPSGAPVVASPEVAH